MRNDVVNRATSVNARKLSVRETEALARKLSQRLRERKLNHLLGERQADRPQAVLSANIGCITHLQAGTDVPVRHWIEVLDEALQKA